MRKFIKVMLVCLVVSIPTHFTVKSFFNVAKAKPSQCSCNWSASEIGANYVASLDSAQLVLTNVACSSDPMGISCAFHVSLGVYELVDGSYVPVLAELWNCYDDFLDCGDSYGVKTYDTSGFKAGGAGSYKVKWRVWYGVCEGGNNTLLASYDQTFTVTE